MRKQLVYGIVMMSFVGSTALAGPTAAKMIEVPRSGEVVSYMKDQIKPHVLGEGKVNASGLAPKAVEIFDSKLAKGLELSSDVATFLRSSLASKDTKQVEGMLDTLVAAAALKGKAKALKLNKSGTPEMKKDAEQMDKVADLLISSLRDAEMLNANGDNSIIGLTAKQMQDAREASKTLLTVGDVILTMQSPTAKSNFLRLMQARQEAFNNNPRLSFEEALIDGAMKEFKLSREDAIKLIERIKKQCTK